MPNAKRLHLVRASFGLGTGRAGAEEGPESMVQAGLLRQLRHTRYAPASDVNVQTPISTERHDEPEKIKHLPEARQMIGLVAEQVSQAVRQEALPLVLGGDHTVTLGVLAGLGARYANVGLIWFDAHADLLTEASSPTGHLSGMTLASALGKTAFKLDGLTGGTLVNKANVVLIGTRELEPEERELIRSEGIACFTMHDIDRKGIENVIEEALAIAGNGTDGIHVSFDIDCLDPLEAPGVELPVPGGLTYREAHFACELLADSERVSSIDIVELNPQLDAGRRTARLAVGLAASMLGKRIL